MPLPQREFMACLLIIFLAANSFCPVLASPHGADISLKTLQERDRLIAEILELDTRLALLQSEKAAAETRLEELRTALKTTQQEKSRLLKAAEEEERVVGRWLRFLVEEGSFTYLDVLLGAANLADFMTRLDIIITIIEANVTSLKQLKSLTLEIAAQEEKYRAREQDIADVYAAIDRSLEEAQRLHQAKSAALAEAEKKLDDFSAIIALSQAWEQVLPDIEHCLNRLATMSWHTIEPDQIKLNYFRGQAEVTFKQRTLEKLLNQGLDPQQDRYQLQCQPGFMVLTRPALDYNISFTIYTQNRRLLFKPYSVTIGQTKVPDNALKLLFQDRELALNIPLMAGLQISQAQIKAGEMQVFLKRGS